ncbi:helix-turn-helix transcriptional regulator [Brevundimonas sp.]|uniref:helix-turn-helix domain-containing protein n=1 Tax=Brevundimonas sp. TaxID=1871086 RepID=UPI002D25F900|nr:helix-turn-helix transcriptional regulator [Brevundimonas sp.]HYC97045.1 helix-turn-helix transcriptional regulator [Brevundimonas sp.]
MSKDLSDAERFKIAVGQRAYLWRLAAGLGRSELAAKAGVSADYVYRLEQGWANPRLDTLHRIACALDTPLEELLAVSEEEIRLV